MYPNFPFHEPLSVIFFVAIVVFLVAVTPYWFIFKKAGFTPWLSLLMFVPLANLITLYVVAFSQWKVIPARFGGPATPPAAGYPPLA